MRFSWTGLLLAPLLAPALFSVVMLIGFPLGHAAVAFLILMVPSCVISYGTTIFLFLPSLFLLSAWRRMTSLTVCLLGLVMGSVIFVPLTWMEWVSSGPDSGPPVESFFVFFARWSVDPLTAIYPVSGLITAALYWRLGAWRHRRLEPSPG